MCESKISILAIFRDRFDKDTNNHPCGLINSFHTHIVDSAAHRAGTPRVEDRYKLYGEEKEVSDFKAVPARLHARQGDDLRTIGCGDLKET